MDAITASPNWSNATADFDLMEKIESEAAEAVAGLAHFPANMSESRDNESVAKRVKDDLFFGFGAKKKVPLNEMMESRNSVVVV
ncbi:hypothetical protein L2E82_20245 [Cichorium intybus]|uniref:Uncharacterized protein n=1 Tax=Cichorium intybus TaxID=13427 RepID=A0ACB9DT58_CICIN|nr:hypothetical protein L2E82_20245 [Cichorium intybus]